MRPRTLKLFVTSLLILGGGLSSALFAINDKKEPQEASAKDDHQYDELVISVLDSIGSNPEDRYRTLTDEDFRIVAEELGVEVAAMKAVVSIEAGAAMEGFWAPGVPIINFDRTMYKKYGPKAPSRAGAKGEKVPEGLTGRALKEWTILINARKENAQGAYMGTFWGMFQIGGFNYKRCDCESVDEFVRRMSYSELEQLQLFAVFIKNSGMLESLKKKDWATFSRKYNGSSYAKRGYHTRMAKAYAKFSKNQ